MTSNIIISIFDSIPLGVMLSPIIICSIILLAVFIERMIFFNKINIDYRLLLGNVLEGMKSKKINEAKSVCLPYSGPLVEFIIFMLDQWSIKENKELLIRDSAEKTIRKVEKFGGVVSTISTIAPMLGLLGTVTGMMQSFSALARLGPTARDQLAQGITVALITTAMGLLVAIPAIMFYNFMVSKIEYYVREIEFISNSMNDFGKKK